MVINCIKESANLHIIYTHNDDDDDDTDDATSGYYGEKKSVHCKLSI
jgi:hypothetical protein